MSGYEIVGFLFGLACVVLAIRENIWNWPAGIVSVVAYGLLFHEIKLYADMALQGFYVVTGFIGWYLWRTGGENRSEPRVRTLPWKHRLFVLALLLPAVWGMGWFLSSRTDASFPFLDSLASTMSVFAQLLMMRKIFETWVLWIAVDLLSIGIYFAKGVYLTVGLYSIFLVLAIVGFQAWRKTLEAEA